MSLQELVAADCDVADKLGAPIAGDPLARAVQEKHRMYRGPEVNQNIKTTAADTVPDAVRDLFSVLAQQRELLGTLYDALTESGLFKPRPPQEKKASDGGCAPALPRLSDRIRAAAYQVRSHNEGIVEILQRLDI